MDQDNKRAYWRLQWHKNRDSNLVHRRIYVKKLKEAALHAYGGPKCACCGEAEFAFLVLDHEQGNGNKERRDLGRRKDWGGRDLYIHLKKNKYPSGYRVLCMNCNFGRYINGGVCPHENRDCRAKK